MIRTIHAISLGLLVSTAAAQQSTPTTPAEPTSAERFATVEKYLEPNGALFFYTNTQGFAQFMGSTVNRFVTSLPESMLQQFPIQPTAIGPMTERGFTALGTSGIQAIGYSAHKRADGLAETRLFTLNPNPTGLMSLYTTQPLPTTSLTSVPADADIVAVMNVKLNQLIPAIKGVGEAVVGPMATAQIDQALEGGKVLGMDGVLIAESLSSPIVFWAKTWETSEVNAEGTLILTPQPQMEVIIPNFNRSVFDQLGTNGDPDITAVQAPGFEAAYRINDGVDVVDYDLFLGIQADNTFRLMFNHQLANPKPANTFVLSQIVENPESVHSFAYSNGVIGERLLEVIRQYAVHEGEDVKESEAIFKSLFGETKILMTRRQSADGIMWSTVAKNQGEVGLFGLMSGPSFPVVAILAAVAVPNFLEAQVRSKVSRIKADQRTLYVGLESHFIDHNQYPANPTSEEDHAWLTALTTPVTYVTSDNFPDVFSPTNSRIRYYQFSPEQRTADPTLPKFVLYSAGPDEDYDLRLIDGKLSGINSREDLEALQYDPANGTVSNGDIIRFSE